MNRMMSFLNNAVANVKQQMEDKRRREAEDQAWVRARPESQVIRDYFLDFFEKNHPGYQFSKSIRRPIWLKVLENAVELSWMPDQVKAQSFSDVRKNCTTDKHVILFEDIYRWHGGDSSGFYRMLDSGAKRTELYRVIMGGLETLPHLKTANGISVKLFH